MQIPHLILVIKKGKGNEGREIRKKQEVRLCFILMLSLVRISPMKKQREHEFQCYNCDL